MKRLFLALLLWLAVTPAFAQQCLPVSAQPYATTPIQASATGTTGAVSATLAAVAGKTTYICGFAITTSGASTATTRTATVSGPSTTMSFAFLDPVTAAGQGRLVVPLPTCIPASAVNTAIVISLPGTGTGTAVTAVAAWGCQQ